jgi:hypothetical protein
MTPTLVARPRREVGAEQARVYAPMGDSKAATTIKIDEGMETRRGEDTVILLFFYPTNEGSKATHARCYCSHRWRI